jgi:hypothetical protein
VLALVPFVAYLLVRAHFGNERVARLTGLGILFWPPFIRYAATLYSDSIAMLGFLCFLAALSAAMRGESEFRRMRSATWLFAGALLGVCIQLKPLYLVYVPIGAALAFAAERQWARRAIAVLLLMTGTIAALAPSSVYLSKREGHFMLVTGNDSETLAGGLNPALLTTHAVYLTGDRRQTWVGPGKWLDAAATGYLTAEELRRPYIERRVLLRERSLAWIRSHPAAVAYLTIRKILYMWGIYPFWNGASQTLLGNCLLIPLMAAAVVSTVRLRRRAHDTALFWTLPLFSTLVACISWGSWRFRMPGDVGLIVLAAALTLTPEGEWRRGGEPPPSPAAAETA